MYVPLAKKNECLRARPPSPSLHGEGKAIFAGCKSDFFLLQTLKWEMGGRRGRAGALIKSGLKIANRYSWESAIFPF